MAEQLIPTTKTGAGFERLLTARDAANLLRLSPSWLAKARMRGDGPPYAKLAAPFATRRQASSSG
jgi:hypothetical protein